MPFIKKDAGGRKRIYQSTPQNPEALNLAYEIFETEVDIQELGIQDPEVLLHVPEVFKEMTLVRSQGTFFIYVAASPDLKLVVRIDYPDTLEELLDRLVKGCITWRRKGIRGQRVGSWERYDP